MSNISVFSGSFCNSKVVLNAIMEQTGYRLITDSDLIAKASQASGLSTEKIGRACSSSGQRLSPYDMSLSLKL